MTAGGREYTVGGAVKTKQDGWIGLGAGGLSRYAEYGSFNGR